MESSVLIGKRQWPWCKQMISRKFQEFKIIQRLYASRSISNHTSLRSIQIKKFRCTIA